MYFDFASVLVFFIFGLVFVTLNVSVLSGMLRPTVRQPEKETTYECGEPPVGSSWIRFDIRFYTVALVFLVFDVELAFLYPWAKIFKSLANDFAGTGVGAFLLGEMIVFVAILVVGYVYVWAKGDLDWVKALGGQQASEAQDQA
jgi:NADH-quinone oxidoreductase subunit A